MRRVAFAAFIALFLSACGPSVSVRRVVPAPYNLGPVHKLVLVSAEGPSRREREVVRSRFLERIESQGVFAVDDASPRAPDLFDFFEQLFSKEKARAAAREADEYRRRNPGDVYVRLRVNDVSSRRRHDTRKKKNKQGEEEIRHSYWAEGSCSFQITLVDGRNGERIARFTVSEEGRSPTYSDWRDDLLETAERDAVDRAVNEALFQFTPQRVTETLALEEKAPGATEGIALIGQGKLREARLLWEKTAKEAPNSAALAYNLGCVSEALGDSKAAAEWYDDAARLDPSSEKYRRAVSDLGRRADDAERLRKRD